MFFEASRDHPRQVAPAQLAMLLGTEAVQVIDTRGDEFYMSHIPGSIHAPASRFSCISQELVFRFRDKGKLLVLVHADSGVLVTNLAKELMAKLNNWNALGICRVGILMGGFLGWEQRFATHSRCSTFITRRLPEYAPESNIKWHSKPTVRSVIPNQIRSMTEQILPSMHTYTPPVKRAVQACAVQTCAALPLQESPKNEEESSDDEGSCASSSIDENNVEQSTTAISRLLKIGDQVKAFNEVDKRWQSAIVVAASHEAVKVFISNAQHGHVRIFPQTSPQLRLVQP